MIEQKLKEMFLSFNRRPAKDQIDVYMKYLDKYNAVRVVEAIDKSMHFYSELPTLGKLINLLGRIEGEEQGIYSIKINKPKHGFAVLCSDPITNMKHWQTVTDEMLAYERIYCPHQADWRPYGVEKKSVPPCMLLIAGKVDNIKCSYDDMVTCFWANAPGAEKYFDKRMRIKE